MTPSGPDSGEPAGAQGPAGLDCAAPAAGMGSDEVGVRRWFVFFGLYVLALAVPIVLMLGAVDGPWQDFFRHGERYTEWWHRATKLLVITLYLSFCTTFSPLPTSWVPVYAAMHSTGVGAGMGMWTTTMLVASAGALGSTMANLTDYHLFTWMLRSRRIARIRETRLYTVTARWFSQAPFSILAIFTILPIPVDVVRLLAITYRYPRLPFAAANFLGRFIRYGVLAWLTYAFNWGLRAVLIVLALAALLGLIRVAWPLARRMRARKQANPRPSELSNTAD